MQEDPTNRELMHYIVDIKDKVGQIKEKDLPEINERVKTTNGSVAEIKAWKERWTGASYVILLVVIPLLSWALYQIVHVDEKVREGVKTALSAYNIETKNGN